MCNVFYQKKWTTFTPGPWLRLTTASVDLMYKPEEIYGNGCSSVNLESPL